MFHHLHIRRNQCCPCHHKVWVCRVLLDFIKTHICFTIFTFAGINVVLVITRFGFAASSWTSSKPTYVSPSSHSQESMLSLSSQGLGLPRPPGLHQNPHMFHHLHIRRNQCCPCHHKVWVCRVLLDLHHLGGLLHLLVGDSEH